MQPKPGNSSWSPGRCPSRQLLVDLSLGKVGSPDFEMWSSHIEQCAGCQTSLESVDSPSDSFVEDLRWAKEPLPAPDTASQLHRMIEQAEAISRDAWQQPESRSDESLHVRTLGRYTVVSLLGRGGMGSVYKAVHAHLQRPVALKLLPVSLAKNPAAVERFRQEMIAVGKLDHPNIVRAYDADIIDGRMFLVMELISGVDLSRLIRKRGPMSIEWACRLTRQAALGLHYAHQHGLIHRDVKPSNLMITKDGSVKLLDLGLARLVTADSQHDPNAQAPSVMGTADFMAPEQGENSDLADGRSDIYSLGCTLYTLLAGRPPFSSDKPQTFFQKAKAHRTESVPPLAGIRGDVPPALLGVIDKMLAKKPDDRFQTADEVATAIGQFTSEMQVVEPPPVPAMPPELPAMFAEYDAHGGLPPSRLRRVLRLAGTAAIIALGVGIVMAMQQPGIVEHLEGLFTTNADEAAAGGGQVRPAPPVMVAHGPAETGQGRPDDVKSGPGAAILVESEPPKPSPVSPEPARPEPARAEPVKPVATVTPAVPTEKPAEPPAALPVKPADSPPVSPTTDNPKPVTAPPATVPRPEAKPDKPKKPAIKLSMTDAVTFEAEAYESIDATLKHNFDKRNSGGAYVLRPLDAKTAGSTVYRLDVPKAGTWYLWALVRGTTFHNNSLVVEVYANSNRVMKSPWHLHPPAQGWRWMTLSDEEYKFNRVSLSLPAGEVLLLIYGREPGVAWDTVMLTPNANMRPKD